MRRRSEVRTEWRRALTAAAAAALALVAAGCATEGTSADVGFYGSMTYNDPWYWGYDCCVDPPADIGPPPPHPEHPIAKPPSVRPEQPIARPPARPAPMPRPAAMPRGGGRR